MLRALVREETKTELLDAAQTLKLRSVDQSHHQLAFIGIGLQTNDVVNWIAIDAFRHCANINRTERGSAGSTSLKSLFMEGDPGAAAFGSVRPLRLKFLDFPIFLDLNGSPASVKSPNT